MSVAGLPAPQRRGRDLLRAPILGSILRWRHLRTLCQSVMLVMAALVVYDGLTGSPIAPRNLAGVAPWVQWRGFTVVSLLVAGSLFCFACPFMLLRRVAKQLLPANRPWPSRLRGKWLAAGLLVAFFWFYEAFDPWAVPWLTATLALAYFAGAFVVDGLFKGAAFCKYLCPIGQFNFVNSLCSPVEVRVRLAQTCRACTTKDCIAGRGASLGHASGVDGGGQAARPTGFELLAPDLRPPTPPARQAGCELFLFQEHKVGNLDCTFCLDCVHACRYDNVGLSARMPARELWDARRRSSIGWLAARPDFAFLALVLVFGAFLNAFGMVGPFYGLERWMMGTLGIGAEWLALLVLFGFGLVLVPIALVATAAWLSRELAGCGGSVPALATRFAFSLVPLGFGMWAAHYGFHFLTGALTLVPVTQAFLADIGLPVLGGTPRWDLGPLVPDSWLLPIELILLEGGLVGSLVASHRIARTLGGDESGTRRAFLPWAMLAVLLFALGVWLLLQPMEMRGTLRAG